MCIKATYHTLNAASLGIRVHITNVISISSAVSVGLIVVTERQTTEHRQGGPQDFG